MKKFLLILCLFLLSGNISKSFEKDYRQIYLDLPIPNFSYVHDMDPGQYYDTKYTAYSPYPLFRLSSPLYFKTITIQPGYYHLTPIKHKGENYVLFKQNGLVKYIIPVYAKDFVPEGFYDSHLLKPKLSLSQKISKNFYTFIGNHFKNAQRRPPVESYLEAEDLDNKFLSLVIYFGNYRYYTIFRTVKL